MKKLCWLLLALVAPLCWATATPQPWVTVQAGDGSVREFRAGDDGVRVVTVDGIEHWTITGFDLGGARFGDFTVDFDRDPFIAFSISVANLVANPTSVVFSFSTPYLGGPYNRIDGQLAADVFSQEQAATLDDIAMDGVVDGTPRLALALPDCADPPGNACGSTSGSSGLAPASGSTGVLSALMAFTVGVRDTTQVSGRVDLLRDDGQVPEPATLLLVLLAAAALGRQTRRLRPAQ